MELTLTKKTQAPAGKRSDKNSEAQKQADHIVAILDKHSAQDIITIDIRGKSSVADYMIIASGRSNRHVSALSEYVRKDLKESGHKNLGIEGQDSADWVLIDIGDVILHIFRPEVRAFYNLEKIWSVPLPDSLSNPGEAVTA